jgi:hypothetical protein
MPMPVLRFNRLVQYNQPLMLSKQFHPLILLQV